MARDKDSDNDIIGTTEAAELLDLTRQRVDALRKDGVLTPRAPGKWHRTELVHQYIAFLRGERAAKTKTAAESRVKDARTRLLDVQLHEWLGHLVDVTEFDEFADNMAGIIISELGALPARHTRDLKERERLRRGCAGILERLAKHCRETAAHIPTTRTLVSAFDHPPAG